MKRVAKYLFKYRSFIPLPFIILLLYYFDGSKLSMIIGMIILGLGEMLRLWGISYAGEITRTTVRLRADSLVTEGPYSIIRNPLYVGNIIIFLGFGIFTMALFPYLQIIIILWFILQYRLIIILEEDFLESRFGNEYIKYKNRVPCCIPQTNLKKRSIGSNSVPDFRNAIKSESRTFQTFFSLGLISLIIYLVR